MIGGMESNARCTRVATAARQEAYVWFARQGEETLRHVVVRFLWLQPAVEEGRLEVLSVPTSENFSDTFTKSPSQADADRCMVHELPHGRRGKLGKHMKPNKYGVHDEFE